MRPAGHHSSDGAVPVHRFADEARLQWMNRRTFWASDNRQAFYINGNYDAGVPAGTYDLIVTRGPEYRLVHQKVEVRPNETSVVNQATPTLSTNAHGNITLGVNGSDLSDTATLAGATAHAGTTITYHLYFGADCSQANEVAGSPVTNTSVNGDGSYDSPAIHAPGGHLPRVAIRGDANTGTARRTGRKERRRLERSPTRRPQALTGYPSA
jgi:hypothetical protein